MENFGIILKRLRLENQLSMKVAAKKIGRSVGWLSEVESRKGRSRITKEEFERIVVVYGGERFRAKFAAWVAVENRKASADVRRLFLGPIYRHIREQSKLSQIDVARSLGLSKSQISKIERSKVLPSTLLHIRLLKVCGYSPASFKNFTSSDKRGSRVSIAYKLEILIRVLPEMRLHSLLNYAFELMEK